MPVLAKRGYTPDVDYMGNGSILYNRESDRRKRCVMS